MLISAIQQCESAIPIHISPPFSVSLPPPSQPQWFVFNKWCLPGAISRHIAYWVQHFPQHHLSGSGIAQLEVYHCQEPAWGTPPVAKVMRKEARHPQRRDRASGVPLEILEHLPPKPESAYFLLCALTYTSDFMVGAVPHYLSLKKELTYSSS